MSFYFTYKTNTQLIQMKNKNKNTRFIQKKNKNINKKKHTIDHVTKNNTQ